MSKWKLEETDPDETPYRFLVVMMDDDGKHWTCGHELYSREKQALGRAQFLAESGRRVGVFIELAASYGTEAFPGEQA